MRILSVLLLSAVTGCGTYGLSYPEVDSTIEDDGPDGPNNNGFGNNGPNNGPDDDGTDVVDETEPDDDGSELGNDDEDGAPEWPDEPVSASVEGQTWAMDLADATFVEPSGLGGMLSLLDSTVLLVHVVKERSTRLNMVMTLAGSDGQQDPCERIVDLPGAEWSTNPEFVIDENEMEIMVGGAPLILEGALFSGIVSGDGSGWSDGVIAGLADTRDLPASLSEDLGMDVCDMVELVGGRCESCPGDGVNACFELEIEHITAEPFSGGFDPSGDEC